MRPKQRTKCRANALAVSLENGDAEYGGQEAGDKDSLAPRELHRTLARIVLPWPCCLRGLIVHDRGQLQFACRRVRSVKLRKSRGIRDAGPAAIGHSRPTPVGDRHQFASTIPDGRSALTQSVDMFHVCARLGTVPPGDGPGSLTLTGRQGCAAL